MQVQPCLTLVWLARLPICGRKLPKRMGHPTDIYPPLRYTQRTDMLTHHNIGAMRTNIDIDDRLMRKAMKSSRSRTKRAAVEKGLRMLIQTQAQTGIRLLRGKIRWQGNLRNSRLGRVPE